MIEGLNDVVLKYAGLNESGVKRSRAQFEPGDAAL